MVCSPSLRGLHSTLAIEAGATASLVAAALGHGSFAVTARHYADPDALLGAQARRVSSALLPGDGGLRASADPGQTISQAQLFDALRGLLTPEQLQQLERKLFCNEVWLRSCQVQRVADSLPPLCRASTWGNFN